MERAVSRSAKRKSRLLYSTLGADRSIASSNPRWYFSTGDAETLRRSCHETRSFERTIPNEWLMVADK